MIVERLGDVRGVVATIDCDRDTLAWLIGELSVHNAHDDFTAELSAALERVDKRAAERAEAEANQLTILDALPE